MLNPIPVLAATLPFGVYPFEQLMLWFALYSFLGWVYEKLFCSMRAHHEVKRGFLYGPYCPIYGFGAVADVVLLGWITNPLVLFAAGAIVAGSMEYVTGWLLETLFNRRWWDYTNRPFNIKGRVCLLSLVVFGVFAVVLIDLIHPLVSGALSLMPVPLQDILAYTLLALFLLDALASAIRSRGVSSRRLDTLRGRLPEVPSFSLERVHGGMRTLAQNAQRRTRRTLALLRLARGLRPSDVRMMPRLALAMVHRGGPRGRGF